MAGVRAGLEVGATGARQPTARVALAVPSGLYVSIELARDPALRGRPVAVLLGKKVLEASPELLAAGVEPGAGREHLLRLCPEACLVAYEPERYADGVRRLLDLYAEHVPAVEPVDDSSGRAFLDVAGLDAPTVLRRLGGLARLELGAVVGFGLGPTKVVAWAAGCELLRKGGVRPGALSVLSGDIPSCLDPLPVRHLLLPPEVLGRLERLGLRRWGEVRAVPLVELARQFGWATAGRIAAAAAGGGPDPVRATWPPRCLEERLRFEGGLADREAFRRALGEAAGRLAREMSVQGFACGELRLAFTGEQGRREEVSRRLVRPERSRAALECVLMDLAERLLGAWGDGRPSGELPEPPEPPAEVEVRAGAVLPRGGEQLTLDPVLCRGGAGGAGGVPSDSGGGARAADRVRAAAAGLAWRFGRSVVRVAGEDGDEAGAPGGGSGDPARRRRRERRERLLSHYDPLRARGRS
ncbi:MAG: hypothetical protein K6U08_02975 [Firmicutes bacterium]|nr:hypothetical protein [Bacillota bacterium]